MCAHVPFLSKTKMIGLKVSTGSTVLPLSATKNGSLVAFTSCVFSHEMDYVTHARLRALQTQIDRHQAGANGNRRGRRRSISEPQAGLTQYRSTRKRR